jgi:hypothetical protein
LHRRFTDEAAGRQSAPFLVTSRGTIEQEMVFVRGSKRLAVTHYKAEEGNRVVGEVEELAPGKSGQLTLNLKPAGRFGVELAYAFSARATPAESAPRPSERHRDLKEPDFRLSFALARRLR